MALQSSITAAGMVILQTAVNSFGNVVVNSMGASTKIMSIATAPMETIGITLATYAGQNLGAGKYSRIVTGIKQGVAVSMFYCVTMAVVMGLFGANLSGIFLSEVTPEIYGFVDKFMKLTVPFYVTLGLLFIFRNVLQGLGYGFIPMLGGIVELVVRSAVAFGLVSRFGYNVICLSGPLAWTAAMFVVVITFVVKIKELRAICGVKKRELYDLSAKKNTFKCKKPEIMECPVC
jgi:Na+-driven multidrug efflux pump